MINICINTVQAPLKMLKLNALLSHETELFLTSQKVQYLLLNSVYGHSFAGCTQPQQLPLAHWGSLCVVSEVKHGANEVHKALTAAC